MQSLCGRRANCYPTHPLGQTGESGVWDSQELQVHVAVGDSCWVELCRKHGSPEVPGPGIAGCLGQGEGVATGRNSSSSGKNSTASNLKPIRAEQRLQEEAAVASTKPAVQCMDLRASSPQANVASGSGGGGGCSGERSCAPSDQSSGTSSPLCDSGLHLNYHPNNTDTLSCSSWPTSPGLRWEKRWCDLRLIPLLHSRFSQYVPGTDLSRQNAFQVIAVDGVCSGIIQCLSGEDCMDWLQAIATNISNLTKHNIKKINRNFPVNQQIVYMGWCEIREQDSLQDRAYTPAFLALRGSCLYKFLAPPVTTWDWTRAEKTFSVYEIMCKILKDSDLLDRRKHCFTVQSELGEDLYFSVELDCDLAQWERAFQTATFLEVERIQCKTYACVLESHLMGLTIDFSTGFICFDAATKAVLWRYKFSQLKGSSDDGKSKIKFLFQNPDTKQIEAKELEFSNLFAVLHCIHSFFAAKVACLDPLFLGNQATASAASSSATTSKAKYTT
ncbi:gamma-1-syntrophin [Carlito syrichta]|uniref:Gamma-1-syntrophin n=1 Tax=Carlito syrichta TaxID=1868482 RepID=A0A1U7T8R4_CARSF|nr:gamma-1-syntrophin [Carlito syrichta]